MLSRFLPTRNLLKMRPMMTPVSKMMFSTSAFDHPVKARITLPAPAFSGMAWADNTFKKVSLSDYAGKYVVLFFYPLDFTFVCPTEICAFNDASGQFAENNA